MEVVRLSDRPALADVLAGWHFAEWAALYPGWSPAACRAELLADAGGAALPATLVAFDGGAAVGSVSLVADDGLPGYGHLSPWVASLYVRPDRRGGGVGGQLLAAAVAEAGRLGAGRAYLFTPSHAGYYAARGWAEVGRASAGGTPVAVMSRPTAAEPDRAGG